MTWHVSMIIPMGRKHDDHETKIVASQHYFTYMERRRLKLGSGSGESIAAGNTLLASRRRGGQ